MLRSNHFTTAFSSLNSPEKLREGPELYMPRSSGRPSSFPRRVSFRDGLPFPIISPTRAPSRNPPRNLKLTMLSCAEVRQNNIFARKGCTDNTYIGTKPVPEQHASVPDRVPSYSPCNFRTLSLVIVISAARAGVKKRDCYQDAGNQKYQ